MSIKYLGEQFDLHTGGVDNIFPHHEDEIAQSEGFTGRQFVNYWVHAQHLLADGQKMAKSTGNAYTCSEVEARGFDPLALRYFYTTALYRSRLNFTFRALQAAQISLERLRELAYQCFIQSDQAHVFSEEPLRQDPWRDAFLAEVEQDLNLPRAMSVVWDMLRSNELTPTARVRLLLDFDRILGFDLKSYLQSDQPQKRANPQTYLAAVPSEIAAQVREREALRSHGHYAQADQVRQHLNAAGYDLRDTSHGSLVLPRRPEDEFTVISSSMDVPDNTSSPDLFEFSINLLAHNSRDDLQRCIESICKYLGNRHIELVIIDNGSTDDTLAYLQQLARSGDMLGDYGQSIGVKVLLADHNMGFAAGRNATMRASRGLYVILMDTSIELKGPIWEPLALTLADRNMGVAGPYGLVTDDLREFREAPGPDVDAIEGYLMAFRRELLREVGWIDEKFRFYRLADIYFSFFVKAAGYRALTTPLVAERIEKHPHREWYSLSEDEQATRSKKNYDIFRDRWHHGESLLVANYNPQNLWRGHDHPYHVEGTHTHLAEELPPAGTMHTHVHRHWPDHSHEHPHYHESRS
jgi:cysteinyl-tRNA synthetase